MGAPVSVDACQAVDLAFFLTRVEESQQFGLVVTAESAVLGGELGGWLHDRPRWRDAE